MSFNPLPIQPNSKPIKTLIIDAGHGGKDGGTTHFGLKEKDINLKIALEVKRLMNENMPDVKVVLTRSTDVFVELKERGKIALKNKGDFFISIHCNSVPKNATSPFGAAFYVLGYNAGQERYKEVIRENEAVLLENNHKELYGGFDPNTPEGIIIYTQMKNVFRSESMNLGKKIDERFIGMKRKTEGVKQAPFIVLWASEMPAVLIETGYLSHKEEAKFLGSDSGQTAIARSIVESVAAYNEEVAGVKKKMTEK